MKFVPQFRYYFFNLLFIVRQLLGTIFLIQMYITTTFSYCVFQMQTILIDFHFKYLNV